MICHPLDQITDQGFGDTGVNAIHRHVIAVIGSPAQRQFGKIPGTDDNPTQLVGKVHQNLGAFPGLGIFIGDIVKFDGVADIVKVSGTGRDYRNLMEAGAESFDQGDGVIIGTVGGAKARHCDGMNFFSGNIKAVTDTDTNQQSHGRVQSPGDPHHHRGIADMGQAGGQTDGLNVKYFFAPFTAAIGISRNKGLGIDLPVKIIGARGFKGNSPVGTVFKQVYRVAKTMLHLPIMIKGFHVNIRNQQFIPEVKLG